MEKKNFPITESIPLKENKEKELVEFIKAISEQLRNEGIPVKDDGRIDMDAFEGELSSKNDIEADKKVVEEYEKEWHKDLSQEEIEKSKTKRDGPKLEMFKTALFNKFLNKDFIVARSSEFDDIKRGIDNVILERSTGNLVCALDEVADESGDRFLNKKDSVLEKNKEYNGNKLRYALSVRNGKVVKIKEVQSPVFYLALSKKTLDEGIQGFIPSLEEKSEKEIDIFNHFISSIYNQYTTLKLRGDLQPVFKKKLEYLRDTIGKLAEKMQIN